MTGRRQAPALGVLTGVDPPERLRALLIALCRDVRLVDGLLPGVAEPAAAAYVWCDDRQPPPSGASYAAWITDLADERLLDGARVLLTDAPAVAARHDRALVVPAGGDPGGARLMPPFVRRRLRAARGLPAVTVLTADGSTARWFADPPVHPDPAAGMVLAVAGAAVDPDASDVVTTALGLASAVVATGPAATHALHWGAPTVTDAATASALGARHDVHLLVVRGAADRLSASVELAGDLRRAARLSHAGHRLARTTCDLGWTAAVVLRRLGLSGRPGDPVGRLDAVLADLPTPADSPARARARAMIAGLPAIAAAPGADVGGRR